MSRREWLRHGTAAALLPVAGYHLALPGVAASEKSAAAVRRGEFSNIAGVRRVKSVIIVFASGGQSQLETWDPKPHAPREVRGAFSPIATSIPGARICEHLPRLAKIANKLTIVRSMSHEDVDHGSAFYLSMTGQYHARKSSNPPPRPTDLPSISSIYRRLRPHGGSIDPAIHVNGPAIVAPQDIAPGQFGGLLGRDFDPLVVPNAHVDSIAVPGLSPQEDLPSSRVERRETLLQSLDVLPQRIGTHRALSDFSGQHRKAIDLLVNPRTRGAFDLSDENPSLRARYGMNRSGQACLLARRLAEAGVPLTTVIWNHQSRGQDIWPEDRETYGWDTHNDIFGVLKENLLPRFDQSFSALINDLDERGMLEETLVIGMGEFGRAPLVAYEKNFLGSSPGRKHWASVYSIVVAGGGVARGKILGKSDRHGGYPVSESYGPWDIAATIFAALGIDPQGHYTDPFGRPIPLCIGRPITGLYAG